MQLSSCESGIFFCHPMGTTSMDALTYTEANIPTHKIKNKMSKKFKKWFRFRNVGIWAKLRHSDWLISGDGGS